MARDRSKTKERKRLKRKKKLERERRQEDFLEHFGAAARSQRFSCGINGDWKSAGVALISVLKRAARGRIREAVFAVDLRLCGLTDCWHQTQDEPWEPTVDAVVELPFETDATVDTPCDIETARRIVAGGIAFAERNGFELPEDLHECAGILGLRWKGRPVDLTGFGHEGDPDTLFFSGELDRLTGWCGMEPEEFVATLPGRRLILEASEEDLLSYGYLAPGSPEEGASGACPGTRRVTFVHRGGAGEEDVELAGDTACDEADTAAPGPEGAGDLEARDAFLQFEREAMKYLAKWFPPTKYQRFKKRLLRRVRYWCRQNGMEPSSYLREAAGCLLPLMVLLYLETLADPETILPMVACLTIRMLSWDGLRGSDNAGFSELARLISAPWVAEELKDGGESARALGQLAEYFDANGFPCPVHRMGIQLPPTLGGWPCV